MKKIIKVIIYIVVFCLVVWWFLYWSYNRQSNILAQNKLEKVEKLYLDLYNLVETWSARSYTEMRLDDLRDMIDQKEIEINNQEELLKTMKDEVSVLYKSLPLLKDEIKKQVEVRNNIKHWL